MVGKLNIICDFSNVKDIVRAYHMIIGSDNCKVVYNVGNGKSVALKEILTYIISLSEQPIKVEIDEILFRPADNPVICCNDRFLCEKLECDILKLLEKCLIIIRIRG